MRGHGKSFLIDLTVGSLKAWARKQNKRQNKALASQMALAIKFKKDSVLYSYQKVSSFRKGGKVEIH